MIPWEVPKIWEDGTCWIIGGGPSMPRQFGVPEDIIQSVADRDIEPAVYSQYLESIHCQHVIAVNNAYQLGEWIDALFFGDSAWYLIHRFEIAKYKGIKVTCSDRFIKKPEKNADGIKFLQKDRKHRKGISGKNNAISWSRNSGGAAINLAVRFGAKKIILLGFDVKSDIKGVSHWHGSHQRKGEKKIKQPYARHLKCFPPIAEDADRMGIEIINASPDSAIECFRKSTVKELLN